MRRVVAAGGVIGCLVGGARTASAGGRAYRVRIRSRPEGAKISDDAGKSLGTTPFDGRLPAGTHTLTFQLKGYQTNIKVVEVRRRRRRQHFYVKLSKLKDGKVTVSLSVAAGAGKSAKAGNIDGAAVLIDGDRAGAAPGTIDVPIGPHQLEVVAKGYKRFQSWIQVTGAPTTVSAVLQPESGAAAPAPAVVKSPPAAGKSHPGPRARGPLAVVSAGLEIGGRSFSYDNPRTANLRPYDANAVPLLRVSADLFPLASLHSKWLRRIAVTAGVARAAPLQSSTDSGQKADTTWQELSAGLRVGFPVTRSTEVRVGIGYGLRDFNFSNAGALADQIPDVSYHYGRFGAGVVATLGRYRIFGAGSYLAVSSGGALAARFSSSSISGMSADLGASRRIAGPFDIRVAARYTRYAYSITSQASDAYQADGGTDQFFGFTVGAAYRY